MRLSVVFTILSISFCLSFNDSYAQTPIDQAIRTAEVLPQWPGCVPEMKDCTRSRLLDFIAANLQQPMEAKDQNAGGVVLVEFVIEKNGTVGEVTTLHDPGMGLGQEAIRVIKLMADKKIKWAPAEHGGKRVPFRYLIPVTFNLGLPAKKTESPGENQVTELDMPEIYEVAEVMPKYAGCISEDTDSIDCTFASILNHIRTNIIYPDSALSVGVQGPVVVEFVIDAGGKITNPVVKRGIGYGCDEEALRLISAMPLWQPGLQNGKPVAVRMVIPIMFQISKPGKE